MYLCIRPTAMKLPTFSLNIFKKPTKKKRIITTFGKRGSSASLSTRKSHHPSSGRKTRKRSITYYAPSKSKFYPSEHFPLQRAEHRTSAVATKPLTIRSYPTEEPCTISTDIDSKLINLLPSNEIERTAKQTYLCDNDYGDIILHQPPAWYMQSKPHQNYYQTEIVTNCLSGSNAIQNKPYTNAAIDSNGNSLYYHNAHNNMYARATYQKECAQGVPIPSMVNAIPFNDSNIIYNSTELHRQSQHNLLPSSVTTAYNNTAFASRNNSRNTKCLPNNNNRFCTAYQSNENQLSTNSRYFVSPIYNLTQPIKKKSDRHRRRKVSFSQNKTNL